MDEFVAMLERAVAPMPDGLIDRVLDAATAAASSSTSAVDIEPMLLSLGEQADRPGNRGRRWLVRVTAAAAVAAAVVAGVVVTHREASHPASTVTVVDPGRLPARVMLGETDFVLTWIPPGFNVTSTSERSVTLSALDWPDIVVSAERGESSIVEPFVDLGPLAQAHFDEVAGLMQWNASGSTLTIDAASAVRPALLGRIAVGIVLVDAVTQVPVDTAVSAKVPNVIGLDYREATAKLAAGGFDVRLGISSTTGTRVGTVESMTPAPSAAVKQGATVALGVIGVAGTAPGGWFLVSGDLPDAVGYAPFRAEPIDDGFYASNEPDPIVFLHGELMGYGIGPAFEPLRRAALAVEPAPDVPPATTSAAPATTVSATPEPGNTTVGTTSTAHGVTLADLSGREWLVHPTSSGLTPWPDGAVLPWVEVDGRGVVSGFNGCTTYGGTVSVVGPDLHAEIDPTEPCEGVVGYGKVHGGRIVLEPDGTLSVSDGPSALPDLTMVPVDSLPLADSLDGVFASTPPLNTLDVDFVAKTNTVFFAGCTASWTLADGVFTARDPALPANCIDLTTLNTADQGLFDLLTSNTPVTVRVDAAGESIVLMNGKSALRLYQLTQPGDAQSFSLTLGRILGFDIGAPVSPDDIVATARPSLGPVEHDTGWYTDNSPPRADALDCLIGAEYRVLWWGDLSVAFRRVDGVTSIWAWSIGDRRASGWSDRREPYAPTSPALTNLTTAGGIHVGSSVQELHVQFGDTFASAADIRRSYADGAFLYDSVSLDPIRWGYVQHRHVVSGVIVVNDIVTGFGAATEVCEDTPPR